MYKKLLSFLCAAALVIPAAGCAAEKKDADFPLTVGHTSLESAVNRAVVLSENAADIILQMGFDSRILAKSNECTQNALSSVDSVGKKDAPNTDEIKSLEPDVVIADSTISDSSLAELHDNDIKVLRFAEIKTDKDLEIMYETLGSLFEGKKTGSENGKLSYQKLLDQLDANAKALPDIPRPKTVCYLFDYKGKTVTGDMMGNMIFTSSGATNIAADKTGGHIDVKAIKKENPQYIFCDTGMKDLLAKNSDFKGLLAVKNKRIVEIPANSFFCGGVSFLEAVKTITDTLYPNGKAGSVADSYDIKYDENTFYTIGDGADNEDDDTDGSRTNIINIQCRLDDLGYWPLDDMTGYYGETTAIAVAEFQSANEIENGTGETDFETLEKMFSDDAVARSEPIEKHSIDD